MGRKDPKSSPAGRLEALFQAGDWHAARAEVRRLRAPPGEVAPAVEAVARRMRPDESAVWAASLGAALLMAVAVLGLFLRWK